MPRTMEVVNTSRAVHTALLDDASIVAGTDVLQHHPQRFVDVERNDHAVSGLAPTLGYNRRREIGSYWSKD